MLLADHDMQHALEQVQTAFPSLTQWAYTNVSDDERSLDGCSLWGQWVLRSEACTARDFSLTFATHAEHWSGHRTIGQHSYFWTSADVGDAHLLDTEACATLEEAIIALKAAIARLCHALSVACMGAGGVAHTWWPSRHGLLNQPTRTSTTGHRHRCASSCFHKSQGAERVLRDTHCLWARPWRNVGHTPPRRHARSPRCPSRDNHLIQARAARRRAVCRRSPLPSPTHLLTSASAAHAATAVGR